MAAGASLGHDLPGRGSPVLDATLMRRPAVDSPAFQQALLQSERLRILILLGAMGAVILVRTLRTVVLANRENFHLWLFTCLLLGVFVGYEALMLRAVQRAMRTGRELSEAVWFANIVVESCLPAMALVFLSSAALDPAYRPLANPAVLLYFLFIILSTLRLNPLACGLSGLVAAASYLAAAVYLGWKPSFDTASSLLSPQKAVISYAITLFVAGIVAGVVARELRKQVDAALREAEMRRQVERLEHDMEAARNIQQSLLPASMPQIEGFEIGAWNRPADQTGGDYYDWQMLPGGKVVVALADVTGHGIGPALLAAVCRAYARASLSAEAGLLAAMDRINSAISSDLGEGRFITFVAVVCTPGASRVELLSAGHGPQLLYILREDRFDKMDAQGLPLGISPSLVSDPPAALDLNPGDLLVLATDGFSEWVNAQGEEFGAARMQQTIRTAREKPPGEIISALYGAVTEFSGGTKQKDDLTAVVIKRI
jgi:serine phosphatase RsbU (regulator of sigma subunit)